MSHLRGLCRTDAQSFRLPAVASPEVKDLGVEDPAKSQAGFNPRVVDIRFVYVSVVTENGSSEILQFRLR
jgi:hypothetical protein